MKNIIYTLFLTTFSVYNIYAQVPHIKWWYNTNDAAFGQSAAADIDGDGKLEIVFGCYRNDSSVYALNAENGTLLWKYNTHPNNAEGCNDVAPIIYDIDNDGLLDVIVPSSCNPKTFCFNGQTGAVKWICDTRGSDSPPTIADLDGDGTPEILHGEFGGYVICINGEDGTVAWEIPVDLNSWIQTAPTIVDLNNDGQLDFVVGTWNFNHFDSVYAFTGNNHTKLWSFPIHDYMYHGTAVADLDNDGKPELVIGSYNDTLYCLNGENGTINWKYAASGGYIGAPASIGDIDNDGVCDVVFVSGYKVTALSNTGNFKWSYNIPSFGGAFRGVVLADINNNAFLDVIFGSENGRLYALNGNNGTLIWSINLATHYGNTAYELSCAPLVSDFDGDDTLDVFVVGGHAEYPDFFNDFGRAYMISASKGTGPDWLMFQRDIRRQSSLCAFSGNSEVEYDFTVNSPVSVFPNPSNSYTIFKFLNPTIKNHTLIIRNIDGQQVYTENNISSDEIKIHNHNLPSGIYFYQLFSEERMIGNGKFAIIKE